jgi:hypothetical protein
MFAEKAVEKLKAKGVANAEEVIYDSYKAIIEAAQETAVEGEGTEKLIATLVAPVLAGFEPEIKKFADLNKDGAVG